MYNMAFSDKLCFLSVVLIIVVSISSIGHSADLISKECGKNLSDNQAVLGNVNTVMLDLVTKASLINGSANSTAGSGNDAVYGIAECRPDMNAQTCSACVMEGAQALRTTCANTTESLISYHQCSLRYANSNFFGHPDTSQLGVWLSTGNTTDPPVFKQSLKQLYSVLRATAAGGEIRKFGSGVIQSLSTKSNATFKIYGMTQCSGDLQEAGCNSCLDSIFGGVNASCGDQDGCFIIAKSCAIRYESSAFLFQNAPPPKANRNITLDIII